MKRAITLFALTFGTLTGAAQAQAASLADLAFLKGNWTSDRSGFIIEESWSDAAAGVLISMSRGAQKGELRFLRFAVIEQSGDTVVMRFKRYHSDYNSWETNGPSVMRLTKAGPDQVVFEASDLASDVKRIIYRARADGAVDVIADRADEKGPYLVEFTLRKSS